MLRIGARSGWFSRARCVALALVSLGIGAFHNTSLEAQPNPISTSVQPALSTAPVIHFPAGKSQVVLKLDRSAGLLFTGDISINGQNVGLVQIDTGANFSTIERLAADRMKLPSRRIPGLRGDPSPIRQIDTLTLGDVTISGWEAIDADTDRFPSLTERVPLIIGSDVLSLMPFTIDCRNQTLILYARDKFQPPENAQRFDLTLLLSQATATRGPRAPANSGQPLVACTIDGIECTTILDTGQSSSLSAFPALIKSHPELLGRYPDSAGMAETPAPMGRAFCIRPQLVSLLGRAFASTREAKAYEQMLPSLGISDARDIATVPTGSAVGMPMLENFRLTFDYAGRHLWVTWNPPKSITEQLARGLDPNSRDLADETPLMRAARRGDAAGVTALIAAGAKVDAQSPRGNTALRNAVEHGDIEVVRLLLAESSNGINSTTDLGETPLMAAADSSSLEILLALLAAGADPKAQDKHKATALHHAAQHGNVSAIEALCKAGADLEGYCDRDLTPLALAAAHGSVEAFDALITTGAKPDAWLGNHVTLLHNAAFSGNPEMVRHVLRDLPMKIDVNASTFDGYTPLITAAEFGNSRAVEILLDAGANVAPATSVRLSGTALHLASINGHTEIVRLLLKHHASTETRCLLGRTPLILAALTARDEALSALLSAGAKIEARDDAGGTALQAAAAMGHADAVRILLNAGASVNAKATRNGRTALHIAASGGHENLIMILLAAGANPAAKDDAGANAADAARAADYELTAQMLEWTARGSH